MDFLNRKKEFIISFFILFLGVFLIWFFYIRKDIGAIKVNEDCFKEAIMEVRGYSMKGIVEDKEKIKILEGYYKCNEVQRGDVIIYNYKGNDSPLIKVIKGMHRDEFKLEKSENGNRLLINGEVAKNSFGEEYVLTESNYKMLSLYIDDYKGVIPQNSFIILGNAVGNSLDSRRFGLIDISDILGKVDIIKKE